MFCLCIWLLFISFLTTSLSHLVSAFTGLILTRFSPFGSAMAVDDQSQPRFSNVRGMLPWQPTFFWNSVFCRNSKTTQDRHMVPGKENVGKFAFCRIAPSTMTSGDLESQNCFRIILLLRVRFAQKVRDRPLRRFFLQLVVEHSSSRFESIRFYSLCKSIRIDSFSKKSAFRFTGCHAVFFLFIYCIVSAKK